MPKGGKMKKIIMYSLGTIGIAAAGLMLIPNLVEAQGPNNNTQSNGGGYGYQQVMETKAETLDMTVDQLRTQLETKTLLQVAEEKGVSEEQLHLAIQESAEERQESRDCTQDQIENRLQNMEERQAANHDSDNSVGGSMQRNRINQ